MGFCRLPETIASIWCFREEGSTTEMKRVQLFPQMTMAYRACVGT